MLDGVIYLHSISGTRVPDSVMRDIKTLPRHLPSHSFIVVTTMWDCVQESSAIDRERELKEDKALLKSFNASGVKFFRHPGTKDKRESTHAILRYLLAQAPPHLIAYVDPL
jgi:hypothetical protein